MKKKVIVVRTAEHFAMREILTNVVAAVKDGWVLPNMDLDEFYPKRHAPGYYEIVMIKNEPELSQFEADIETLNLLTKKDDLLQFAASIAVAIPDEVKIPTAIQKFLREYITANKETLYGKSGTNNTATVEADFLLGLTGASDDEGSAE